VRELAEPSDTHLDIPLDDDEPTTPRKPVYVDVVAKPEERRPIIPAGWHGWTNIKATLRYWAGVTGYRAGYHSWRLLLIYTPLALFWSLVGVARLTGRLWRWWTNPDELQTMLNVAIRKEDIIEGGRKQSDLQSLRASRGWRILACLAGLVAVGVLLYTQAPRWALAAVIAPLIPWLAHLGRPQTMPIISPAVVIPRYRRINADIVLRAYYAAGLGHPDKPDQQISFGSTMQRDGEGSRVLIDLPYGLGLEDAVKARGKIASGLDVAISQVFITRDPTSHRRHMLWVADRDPLAIPSGRTPLLKLQPTDIWQPAPFGLDERGRLVTLAMLWTSILIGAQPRQGKSFSARLLALYAALDPHVELFVFDGKGSPDWRGFRKVATRCAFGLAMTRDGDPLDIFLDTLRELKADVQQRYQRLSELPVDVCPEGKLTRDIARNRKYRMPVRLLVVDECQEYFDTPEKEKNVEIAQLLVFLVKVAPAAGYIVLDATQKPSDVGSGEVKQKFTSFRDNHQTRFSLRTGSFTVSEMVLGQGAYGEGFDSSTLLPEYKGVGILRGASDATPTVRTFLADAEDAERILLEARRLRERAGTLTGMAAGEDMIRQQRDVMADARSVFYAGDARISWPELAHRMAELMPQHYADLTPEAVSAQLRALGVTGKSVKDKRWFESGVGQGFDLAALEDALASRQVAAGSGSSQVGS
jgi:S-DNA-T family DNA segregation ATPase FtsK/SpoIIIE